MKRKNILFLRSGFHKEFALKSMIEAGFDLIVVDEPNSSLLPFAKRMFTIDNKWDENEMFSIAKQAYIENDCLGIISFLDSSTIAYGMLSDYFNLNYFSEETARILSNKIRVRELLTKEGLNSVNFCTAKSVSEIYDAMETWKTPVVIKPSDRSASKGVVIVRDSKDIEAAYKESLLYSKNKEILVEEYIEGIEYCAEYFIVDSTPYIMAVSEKEVLNEKYCVELKDVTPARLPLEDYDKINKYLSKVIRAIGFNNGIVHIELKKENDMISIIEINSRCAGGNLLESVYHLSGYNPYTNLANLLCKVRDEVSIPKLIDYNADSLFTIFDTFSYKGRSGVIKKIENTQVFNEIKRYPEEKFFLYVNKGNFVGETENNEDSIGSIYLMDKEYDSLITRCKQLEDSIGVYVGDE